MHLADIITPTSVKVLGATSSKKRLLQDLGDLAGTAYGLSPANVVEALIEREGLGPTGVGHGVALPHARIDEVDRIRGLFIRLEKPLDFESIDRQPVDLVFALLAPVSAGVDHLKALALVSRTLRDTGVRTKLRANADPGTLYTILTESRPSQAA
jgi:PTS system nitrogen regulatory IIA component